MKKRRAIIFGTAAAIYAAILALTWVIGTRDAVNNTEAQLDYGVLDVHHTLAGAIDTMLGHVARIAVRHLGKAEVLPRERMEAGAKELDIDEVNTVTRQGLIISSNDPHCMGACMAGDPVMNDFMELTNGVTATVSQPFRPHARNPKVRAKYLAAAFPGGDGFVQVGLDETRLAKILPSILGYIFDRWLLGETGFFLCADMDTGRLISNPACHLDEAKTLAETGYDVESAKEYEFIADGKKRGKTFTQRLFGEKCYCRAFIFGGHRFVTALPEREFFHGRDSIMAALGAVCFLIFTLFALFTERIFSDSARLKAFYKAADERRAKDMEIAKTIQNSALPDDALFAPGFTLAASMQAAKDVGGDFYDYFPIDSTHFAFLIADVSGKSITAALYMMTAKTLIKDTLLAVHDPAEALTKVNAELCRNNPANMFLTAWVGVLDAETGIVTYANAGHNPPVLALASKFENGKSGPVLAFMDGITYKSRTLKLEPGEALFLYTDGVTEALDLRGELFGEARLLESISAIPEPEPKSICNVVRMAVAAFAQGAEQADDITVLALRYTGAPKALARSFAPTQKGISESSDYLDAIEGIPPAVIATLHIILDEICSNIVKHSGASGFIIELDKREDAVEIVFADDGAPYDPLKHTDPDTTLPAAQRPIGGLGIMMVKKMSDAISYSRKYGRNILSVVKKFNKSGKKINT